MCSSTPGWSPRRRTLATLLAPCSGSRPSWVRPMSCQAAARTSDSNQSGSMSLAAAIAWAWISTLRVWEIPWMLPAARTTRGRGDRPEDRNGGVHEGRGSSVDCCSRYCMPPSMRYMAPVQKLPVSAARNSINSATSEGSTYRLSRVAS